MAGCALAAALAVGPASAELENPFHPAGSCVVIDNDYDIDDMMAIPSVIANRRVAAIVQTEGYTLPEQAAPAANALINASGTFAGAAPIPIIVGARQSQPPDLRQWPWMPFFRAMMNRSNGLLAVEPRPWPRNPGYPQAVRRAVARCQRVSVLLTAPFTSFLHYAPLIRHKLDRVVITGRRLDERGARPSRISFNCLYDLRSCQAALPELKPDRSFFVTVPDLPGCQTVAASRLDDCYTPSFAMVAGELDGNGRRVGGLLNHGLPHRLKQALINGMQCSSLYTTPQARGRACSSLSTWEPAAVASGPQGRVLLWDQSTALFLLYPNRFTAHGPRGTNAAVATHYEPSLVAGSHAETVKALRVLWTAATNHGSRQSWVPNRRSEVMP